METEKTLPEGEELKETPEVPPEEPKEEPENEETVVLKKAEYDQFQADFAKTKDDLENYKRVALGKKRESKEKPNADKSEFITKDEFYKDNQKKAIKISTTIQDNDPDPVKLIKKEIDENWDDVVKYYSARSGHTAVEDIVEDVFDAHAAWKRRQKQDGGTPTDLSIDAGKGGKTPPPPQNQKRSILFPQGRPDKDQKSTWLKK